MRYELLNSKIEEDGNRIIKIWDSELNKSYLYYTQELPNIKEPGLKSFLLTFIKDINEGNYDI